MSDTVIPNDDTYILDAVSVPAGSHALIMVAFYGSSRKKVVVTDPRKPSPFPITPCAGQKVYTHVVDNFVGSSAIEVGFASTIDIRECNSTTEELRSLKQCKGSGTSTCPAAPQHVVTSYVYPADSVSSGNNVPAEAVGITIVVQAGIGPDNETEG